MNKEVVALNGNLVKSNCPCFVGYVRYTASSSYIIIAVSVRFDYSQCPSLSLYNAHKHARTNARTHTRLFFDADELFVVGSAKPNTLAQTPTCPKWFY